MRNAHTFSGLSISSSEPVSAESLAAEFPSHLTLFRSCLSDGLELEVREVKSSE